MIQADGGDTALASRPATGISHDVSRRALLGGAMLAAGAVALPVAAAAMPAGAMPFYDPRLGRDARFWALHREWEQVLADAEEDADESDEAFDRWSDRINEVETAMMLTPVTTAAAVHAKYLVDKGRTEATYERGGQEFTTGQLIEWDLERLIKQELWA